MVPCSLQQVLSIRIFECPSSQGKVIGVEETGSIYSWNIDGSSNHPVKLGSPNIPLIDEPAGPWICVASQVGQNRARY